MELRVAKADGGLQLVSGCWGCGREIRTDPITGVPPMLAQLVPGLVIGSDLGGIVCSSCARTIEQMRFSRSVLESAGFADAFQPQAPEPIGARVWIEYDAANGRG